MSISEHELDRLRGIELRLASDDPRLAAMLRGHRLPSANSNPLLRVAARVALLLVAVLLVAIGIAFQAPPALGLGIAGLCVTMVCLAGSAGWLRTI